MDLVKLIKLWPQWQNAGAEVILASPALAVPVEYRGKRTIMRPLRQAPEDTLNLSLRFENETCTIFLADSPDFGDLHRVWSRRRELPRELLLALLEVSCGELLQALESIADVQLSVVGLSEDTDVPSSAFELGGLAFAIQLPICMKMAMGNLANLDFSHESIRSLAIGARASFGTIELPEEEIQELAAGDCLLFDEESQNTQWLLSLPATDTLRICAKEETTVTFGQIADNAMPDFPPSDDVAIYYHGQMKAEGARATIGEQKCFKLTHLL